MVLQRDVVVAYTSLLRTHPWGYSDFNSWLHVFPALLGSINMELRGSFPLLPCSVSDDKFPCCWGLSRWGPFGVPASGSAQESCPPLVQSSFRSTDPNLRSPGFGGDSWGGILPQHMFFPQGLCSHFLCDLSKSFPFVLTQQSVLKGVYFFAFTILFST